MYLPPLTYKPASQRTSPQTEVSMYLPPLTYIPLTSPRTEVCMYLPPLTYIPQTSLPADQPPNGGIYVSSSTNIHTSHQAPNGGMYVCSSTHIHTYLTPAPKRRYSPQTEVCMYLPPLTYIPHTSPKRRYVCIFLH